MAGAEAVARAAELAELVESGLGRILSNAGEHSHEFGRPRLLESMRYSLSTPGKRIRPLLLLATVESVGGPVGGLTDFACALEMIHAYSLIHDDLPDMDDDNLRRGLPTNHVVFGAGMAILAGDGLLTEAFQVLLRPVKGAECAVGVTDIGIVEVGVHYEGDHRVRVKAEPDRLGQWCQVQKVGLREQV